MQTTSKLTLRKILFSISLCSIIVSIFIMDAKAQVVNANLIITPPYSVYFRDYAGYGRANNMLLSIFSTTNRKVFLSGSITKDDNSIVISAKSNYRPLVPIQLTAGNPLMLTGLQLRNIFSDGSTGGLNLTGISAKDIALNQALPEGNYTFCIQVKDYDSRELISSACKNIFVTYNEPPQILTPIEGIAVQAFNPQMLMVTWQNSGPMIFDVSYRLKIVKLIKGITPLDALNNNVQLIMDKGNIKTTNFPLDISSGVKLEPGQLYAMQVSAESSSAYFKNNGKSEVRMFIYQGSIPADLNNISLNFLNPVSGKDTISVNNENPFLLSWNFFDNNNSGKLRIKFDSATYKKYGVEKYIVKITPALNPSQKKPTDKNFSYQTILAPDSNNILHSNLIFKEEATDKMGFKDNYWYNATVTALDNKGHIINRNSSVDFLYRKSSDKEIYLNTSARAIIKYGFEGYSEEYYASYTPVQVQVLQKSRPSSNKPIITIGNTTYNNIASSTDSTDQKGVVNVNLNIPVSEIKGDSLYYRILMDGAYYIDKDFKLLSVKVPSKDSIINKETSILNFGQLFARTYGYSLTVNVNKAFPSYRITNNGTNIVLSDKNPFRSGAGNEAYATTDSGVIYNVNSKKAIAGITMVLYRKNKHQYIPPVEGNLKSSEPPKYGNVEVARGVTTIAIDSKGNETSIVKFDRLLSNIFEGDKYFIIALKEKSSADSTYKNSNSYDAISSKVSLLNPYGRSVYSDDHFVATEKSFRLLKPLNIDNKDSLYRNVTVNYQIISKKPPTSLLKGRLLYQWKSDSSQQIRPLAKQKFKVVVDYLVNNQSIGAVCKSCFKVNKEIPMSKQYFVPEGSKQGDKGMQLLDGGETMGTGTTDEQGNFSLDVINLNKKGVLGKGKMVTEGGGSGGNGPGLDNINPVSKQKIGNYLNKGKSQTYEPSDHFTNNQNGGLDIMNQVLNKTSGMQEFLNGNLNFTMQKDGSFSVSQKANGLDAGTDKAKGFQKNFNGPNANSDNEINDDNDDDPPQILERVFRIIPDDPHYRASEKNIVVQPFEASVDNSLTSNVAEIVLRVHTMSDKKMPLNGVKVVVFRSLDDKEKNLPDGEGDGKYLQKLLINPQYEDSFINKTAAKKLDQNNIFHTKFEYLWPASDVNSEGITTFKTLFHGYGRYYIEATSDPEQGNNIYQATFLKLDANLSYGKSDTVDVTLVLNPLGSRAIFRLQDSSTKSSIPYGKIKIEYSKNSFFSSEALADKDGYTELLVIEHPLIDYLTDAKGKFIDGKNVYFSGEADGYKPSNPVSSSFQVFGQQFHQIISLNPASHISGRLVSHDEKNKGVEGYIITPSGKWDSTKADGTFSFDIADIAGSKIKIIPKDVKYFDTSYQITSLDVLAPEIKLNDIAIYERKHRIRFIVENDAGISLSNAKIELGDKTIFTESGKADFEFTNVSINNYTAIIHGPEGYNYIPITKNIKNEESTDLVIEKIIIESGSEISGIVTLNGQPVSNAKVYIDANAKQQLANNSKPSGAIKDDVNLLQAYTDLNGKYTLHGVPVNNQFVDLLATLDTTFAVSGDRKKANIINKKATTDLSMTGYKDLVINSLYGFPLSVEKIDTYKDGYKVTGLVHWTESISNFTMNEINKVVRVENVYYKAVGSGKNKIGVAQDDNIPLEGTALLNLKYLEKYNVQLSSVSSGTNLIGKLTPQPLKISKENDNGVIKGNIQIIDNSFNYPGTYLSFNKEQNFFFAEKNRTDFTTNLNAVKSAVKISEIDFDGFLNSSRMNNRINLIKNQSETKHADDQAFKNISSSPDYYLTNSNGENMNFKFIDFDAKAEAKNSFIDKQGKIHLNIGLACHIDNFFPADFTVNIPEVILDENKVSPASGAAPIELTMEKGGWTLLIKDWKISPEEGGITSKNGVIKTNKIDIPFSTFVLRHDIFNMADFKIDQLGMGGIVNLVVDPVAAKEGQVVFDNKTGTDGSPHWRFTLSGTGAPVAIIKKENLPGLSEDLGIDYIQILSNNESVFQMKQVDQPQFIFNNPLAKFISQSITSGPDFFTVSGSLNVGAPRMSDMSLDLKFKKEGSVISMKPSKVDAEFEGKGFVHFTSNTPTNNQTNITISKDVIIIDGKVEEKPSKSFDPIPASFIATAKPIGDSPMYKVQLPENYVMPISNSYKLTLLANSGMSVKDGDWGMLSYQGTMESTSATDKGIKPIQGVKFTVLGDVNVEAKQVTMDNIETPFGNMAMIFNFETHELIGKLDLNNVMMGPNAITGTVETLFGPNGFYVAGGGTADIKIGNPFADGVYNLGFMVGSYPIAPTDELWKIVSAFKDPAVKDECFVSNTLKGRLAGFYMSIDRVLFDVNETFDFIIVSGYVNAKAMVGADMWANFSDKANTLGISVMAYARAAAGMSAVTGTSLTGELTALAKLILKYESSKVQLNASVDVTFKAAISQSLGITSFSADKTVGCSVKGGTNGFDFDLHSGDPVQICK